MARVATAILLAVVAVPSAALADVERVEVKSRRDVLNGQSFGSAGPYEAIAGTLHIAVDPANARNRSIPDLDRAPRGEGGRVRASADFQLLRPKDPARGNHVLLLDIANRGSRIALRTLDHPARTRAVGGPDDDLGDGFLLQQGFTILWVGWQADLPGGAATVRADLPRALGVEGFTRSDFTLTADAPETRVAGTEFNPPLEREGAGDTLLVRTDPYSPATAVPRNRWRFSEDRRRLIADDGLKAGSVYDVIFKTRDPFVAGLGFAAVRDAAAAARAGRFPDVSVTSAIVFGVSQSGRMLRDFISQGFNAEERGARVFDGFIVHIAGGARGSFIQRFAASGGDTYFYPVRFPFTPGGQTDPVTGERDGLLSRATADNVVPKMFFINSAVEYWGGRAASLTHTTVDGTRDVAPSDSARIYFLAGQQHGPAAFPPKRSAQEPPQQLPNSLDATWVLRALVLDMKDWINKDTPPPESRYPRIADRTLVAPRMLRFPAGIGATPARTPLAVRLDMGRDYKPNGVAKLPAVFGAPYTVLVPAVDADGNEIAGVHVPELAAPLGTHTGWNFRDASIGSPQSFVRLIGSYIPFALTRREREAAGDQRRSIEERYRGRDEYVAKAEAAARRLVADRLLLADDVAAVVARAAAHWDWRQAAGATTAAK